MPSEVQGLVDLSAYLKYGNHVAHFSIPYVTLEDKYPDFIRRQRRKQPGTATPEPAIKPEKKSATQVQEQNSGHDLGMQVS
jgi:hypothetical protein